MDRLFNMDNKFFTFMGKVADLMILNIVFLICCIPIITIGASVTAMNYVTLKMVKNEDSYIIKSFFKSFKANFKQATIIWLILLVVSVLIGFDFRIMQQLEVTLPTKILNYGIYMITFIFAMLLAYIFPLLSKFENTIINTFKNSLLMAIRHLPSTFLILIITFLPAIASILIPIVLIYGAIVWILIGFALTSFLTSLFFTRIFARYIPEEETVLS